MEAITIPHVRIPSINIGGICLPGIGAPGSIGKKRFIWPAGMKEHIKAWYDPKKQGMTNFDVIEAYMEDFTTWTVNKEGVIANVTSKSITITNVLNSNPLIYAYDTFSVRLRIDGLKNGQGIFFGDNKEYTISENGIYDIDTTENIRTNFIGECNITITQLPTSILKDFSDNGNHAYLYGGKGKLNSGMGVYNEDFTTYTVQFDNNKPYEQYYNKVIIHNSDNYISNFWKNVNKPPLGQKEYSGFKLKISGLPKNSKVNIRVYYGDDYSQIKTIEAITDEIVVIPKTTANVITANKTFTYIDFNLTRYKNTITIEQIPDYPDQLCYDGKMYAAAYDMPILTDYTVMAERTWFEKEEYSAFISNSLGGMEEPGNGAFSVELKSLNSFTTISFGSITSIGIPEKGITYQTKQSYNGNSINVGTKESNDILILGGRYFYKNGNVAGNTWTGCHGAIIVADRSLTEEEINWLKQNWDKI